MANIMAAVGKETQNDGIISLDIGRVLPQYSTLIIRSFKKWYRPFMSYSGNTLYTLMEDNVHENI